MGNCCGIHGSTTSSGIHTMPGRLMSDKEGFLVSDGGQLSGGGGSTGDQVRIKISKQQLETLMRRAEIDDHDDDGRKRMRVEEMLQRLIDESEHIEVHHHNHTSWRPSLESIPEDS